MGAVPGGLIKNPYLGLLRHIRTAEHLGIRRFAEVDPGNRFDGHCASSDCRISCHLPPQFASDQLIQKEIVQGRRLSLEGSRHDSAITDNVPSVFRSGTRSTRSRPR